MKKDGNSVHIEKYYLIYCTCMCIVQACWNTSSGYVAI